MRANDVQSRDRHRYSIGGMFLLIGLVRAGMGLFILSTDPAMAFSASMIAIGLAVPSLFGAYNLLTGNSSSHSMLMIASLINVFSLPVGTALSIYYYWFWKYQCGSPNPLGGQIYLTRTA